MPWSEEQINRQQQVTSQWATSYANIGLRLVPIPIGSKGPSTKGWNLPGAGWTPDRGSLLSPNCGLHHLDSKTISWDIDQEDETRAWCQSRGVDYDAIMSDQHLWRVLSGRDNRNKVVWSAPPGIDLRRLKSVKLKDGKHDIFEFRCVSEDGLSLQDVLPPSIHPDTGMPYRWSDNVVNDWPSGPPPVPQQILDLWMSMIAEREVPSGTSAIDARVALPEIQEMLQHIDPDIDRDGWLRVAMALHVATDGSDEGYRLFDTWSQGGAKYAGESDTWGRWRSFRDSRHTLVTTGTLVKMARDGGWLPTPEVSTEEFLEMVDGQGTGPMDAGQGQGTDTWQQAADVSGQVNNTMDQWRHWVDALDPNHLDWDALRRAVDTIVRYMGPGEAGELQQRLKTRLAGVVTRPAIARMFKSVDNEIQAEKGKATLETSAIGRPIEELEARYVYVAGIRRFLDVETGLLFSNAAVDDRHGALELGLIEVARNTDDPIYSGMTNNASLSRFLLRRQRIVTVDQEEMSPGDPLIYERGGVRCVNTWTDSKLRMGVRGDPSMWIEHFHRLYDDDAEIGIKFMAYTLQYPAVKINWALILGGHQGTGKDWLLKPVMLSLGPYWRATNVDEMGSSFTDYLMGTKGLYINEMEQVDFRDRGNQATGGKIKGLVTDSSGYVVVNRKGIAPVTVRNVVNVFASTNSREAISVTEESRRYAFLWSDWHHSEFNQPAGPQSEDVFSRMFRWMDHEGGADAVIWYLRNDVDLSDFPAQSRAPYTSMMDQVEAMSRHPLDDMLEWMIANDHPAFRDGICQIKDVAECLMANSGVNKIDFGIQREVQHKSLGNAMSRLGWRHYRKRGSSGPNGKRAWVMAWVDSADKGHMEGPEMEDYLTKRGPSWVQKT